MRRILRSLYCSVAYIAQERSVTSSDASQQAVTHYYLHNLVTLKVSNHNQIISIRNSELSH